MNSRTVSRTNIDQAISFVSRQGLDVKALSGFQKHHRVPTGDDDARLRYIAGIAHDDIDANLSKTFSKLKSAFGFKRREISVEGPVDGSGSIVTPYFSYHIDLLLDEDSESRIVWRRSIKSIKNHEQVFSSEFHSVFGESFDFLEWDLPESLNLEAIIDHVEDAEAKDVGIDYDKDVTWCEISMPALLTVMRIDSDSMTVTRKSASRPEELLQSFWELQKRFLETLDAGE